MHTATPRGAWAASPSPWLYSGYYNPYITPQTQTIIVQQPVPVPAGTEAPATAATAVAFDYSKPIGVTENPPEPGAVDTAQETLAGARESFKTGDYARALALTDQALAQTPNDPILHEFRALVLFALKRYEEAAATAYAVLTAGPGWNWATMVGLYPDVDTYSNQLRAARGQRWPEPERRVWPLPACVPLHGAGTQGLGRGPVPECRQDSSRRISSRRDSPRPWAPRPPNHPSCRPSLHRPAIAGWRNPWTSPRPEVAIAHKPRRRASLAHRADVPLPPAPPQNLQGQWSAKPNDKTAIALSINPDGTFAWTVTQDGKSQKLEGWAGYQDQILTLAQEQGPPLVGKVTVDPAGNRFAFKPPGTPESVAGLSFEKTAAATGAARAARKPC